MWARAWCVGRINELRQTALIAAKAVIEALSIPSSFCLGFKLKSLILAQNERWRQA